MLEKMDAFFTARLAGYDAHMRTAIAGAAEFYPFTAAQLPMDPDCEILDLGCGTGLELEDYFSKNPAARVTGIDLSAAMLGALREKFPDKQLRLLQGSYFDLPFGENRYAAALSVESLHHFTPAQKLALYQKLLRALMDGGYFILTDYFAETAAQEREFFDRLDGLKREQGIIDDDFYHCDTPLTAAHEIALLKQAGFSSVSILKSWGATCTLKAVRRLPPLDPGRDRT